MPEKLFDKRQDPYFKVENVIFAREDLSAYEKLVYMVLCRYANNNDGAFPSYETIAKGASVSRATAIRTIKSLVEKNLVEKETRLKANSNENTSNIYYVLSAEDKKEVVSDSNHLVSNSNHVVSDSNPKKNYIKNNNINKKSSSKAEPQKLDDDAQSFSKAFEEKTGAKFRIPSAKNLLKTNTAEVLREKIDEYKYELENTTMKIDNIAGNFHDWVIGNFAFPKGQAEKKAIDSAPQAHNFSTSRGKEDDYGKYYKNYDE